MPYLAFVFYRIANASAAFALSISRAWFTVRIARVCWIFKTGFRVRAAIAGPAGPTFVALADSTLALALL